MNNLDITDESVSEMLSELRRIAGLGRKMEALLASEEPPRGLDSAVYRRTGIGPVHAAWDWFREQLLGPVEAVPLPLPATGGRDVE